MKIKVMIIGKSQSKDHMPSIAHALGFRMEQYGHKQKDIVRIIGSASHVSEILSGKRKPSLEITKKLFKYGIPPAVLLQ